MNRVIAAIILICIATFTRGQSVSAKDIISEYIIWYLHQPVKCKTDLNYANLHLSDATGRRIWYSLNTEEIKPGVAQAIAIALILNEAVTNAIKYAFPGNSKGVAEITLIKDENLVSLAIEDNGIGISEMRVEVQPGSLGLKLIEGLSESINGHLSIENDHGTKICSVFDIDPLVDDRKQVNILNQKTLILEN